GIECDGATYHSGRDAHLRDVWRETILRSRGWKLHRIWSTRWWYHRAQEIDKLEHAIQAASPQREPSLESAAPVEVNCLQVSIKDAQPLHEAVPSHKQVEASPSGQSRIFLTSGLDQNMTLGQLREKFATSGEFRGSWERFLEFVKLPLGLG